MRFEMWTISTDEGDFEAMVFESALKQVADWTVDDMNGEHTRTPNIKEIITWINDAELHFPSTDELQDELERMCIEEQEKYDEGVEERRENHQHAYM